MIGQPNWLSQAGEGSGLHYCARVISWTTASATEPLVAGLTGAQSHPQGQCLVLSAEPSFGQFPQL